MKFYESGDNRKPVIFLFPGTCCLYSSFDHVLDGLHSYFYTVTVSYDGFDPNEKTEFYSMEDECEKIEQEIRKKYGGRIYLVAKIQSSMVVPFMYKWYIQVLFQNLCRKSWIRQTVAKKNYIMDF